jgi:LemA protein
VKGFAAHEEEVFTRSAEARSKLAGAGTVEEKGGGERRTGGSARAALVVVESYPRAQGRTKISSGCRTSWRAPRTGSPLPRKRYNDTVKDFNTRIRMFPGSIIAGRWGLRKNRTFEISQEAGRRRRGLV